MPMTRFLMTRDNNGYNAFGLIPSNTKYQTLLQANLEQTLTVPGTGDTIYPNVVAIFLFQPGANVWVAINDTATVPSFSFLPTSSESNPQVRHLSPGDVISFITNATTAEVGVIFYATK